MKGGCGLALPTGVVYQDGDGFNRFTSADGLPHSSVTAMFQDREHLHWFATWGGVGLYDAHSISVFDFRAKLSEKPSEISQIVQDSHGDIWIGCVSPVFNYLDKSLFRFDGDHCEHVSAESGLDINNCFAIYEDSDGCLWFGGRNGLFRYDGQKIKEIRAIADVREKVFAQSPRTRKDTSSSAVGKERK